MRGLSRRGRRLRRQEQARHDRRRPGEDGGGGGGGVDRRSQGRRADPELSRVPCDRYKQAALLPRERETIRRQARRTVPPLAQQRAGNLSDSTRKKEASPCGSLLSREESFP